MVGNNVSSREVWTTILGKVDKLLNTTWKDRHTSYRGKLVVFKHLALPIIMFTAPFIHMPQDMADKLDRMIRKFIFSGKKCKVALETLKLPIEYGGMNVPNIRFLTDAARIRWIKKMVDDQTPVIWRNLAIHMLNTACDTTMGTNILRHSEMKVTHTRNPHLQHWLWVLKAWRRLEGQGNRETKTLDEVKAAHLTEIDPKVGKQLARHGYNTIQDIIAPDTSLKEPKYVTRAQLVKRPGHNMVSAKTYQEFVEKLPKETAIPTHIMDSQDPYTVYKVIEETCTELRRSKRLRSSKGRTHIPHKSKPKLKVQQMKVLDDCYVINSDKPNLLLDLENHQQVDIHNGKLLGKTTIRGNAAMEKLQLKLDGKLQSLEKYTRMKAYSTLQQTSITTHKHHRKWDTIFPDEAIDWPTLNTHPTNNPNLINIRFLLMHGAIRVGSQARHWIKNSDLSCPSCQQQCNDIHLFLDCPTTMQAWQHVEKLWTSLQRKFQILQNYTIKRPYKLFGPPSITARCKQEKHVFTFLDILLGHMQTIIWNSYTNKIFNNIEYNANIIIETYQHSMKKSLQCFLYAMKQKSYIAKRWACPTTQTEETQQKEKTDEQGQISLTQLIEQAIATKVKPRRNKNQTIPNTAIR